MPPLPTKKILPIKPAEYLQQGPTHCGAYSVKGILSAFGIDETRHPKEYHPSWLGKITGFTLGNNYYVNILRSHGVKADRKTASHLPDLEKVYALKWLLANGAPVMVNIGNGYINSQRYNPFLGRVVRHWITLWGYDDNERVFYVYDSALPKQHWDQTLPIGNTSRSYNELLRDWSFGKWQFWYWYMGRDNFVYIQVDKNSEMRGGVAC
jgi:hypothetical protein